MKIYYMKGDLLMPVPPVRPTKHPFNPNAQVDYFEYLLLVTRKQLKTNNSNLSLKADGLRALLTDYSSLKRTDYEKAWELAKDFNLWADYFSGMANTIQKEFLDSNTKKIKIQAEASFDADSTKVANGDRLSNKNSLVVDARTNRNTFKSFHDGLLKTVEFLERAHYHCKSTYEMVKFGQNIQDATGDF